MNYEDSQNFDSKSVTISFFQSFFPSSEIRLIRYKIFWEDVCVLHETLSYYEPPDFTDILNSKVSTRINSCLFKKYVNNV